MIFKSSTDLIGNTPMLKFHCDELEYVNIYVKMESLNPSGSIKDRACISLINRAIEDGELNKSKTILDASSGNMACAISFFGKVLGYKTKVICNSKLTEDKRQFIKYFGAELSMHGDITIEGNRFCARIAKENPQEYCFLDQLHNPANPLASYRTLGPEILTSLPDVNAIFGSMGSGGSMCGTFRYFRENKPNTMLFTTQAASGTKIPGTGGFVDGDYITPFITEMQNECLYDESFLIHQKEAEERTTQLASQGIFVGFQGGGVLHSCIVAIKKYNIKGDVVIVVGDSGWKNMEKLIK